MQENQPIQLSLVRLDGVPKLRVKCDREHAHLVTSVRGGNLSKKYDAYFYPLDAVFHFFTKPMANLLAYTEDVYTVFDQQRKAFEGVRLLISGEKEPTEHAFLFRHQRVAVDIAKLFDKFALFMATGTGKTLTGLEIIKQKGGKWCIIVPRPIIKTGWMQDAIDFYPDIRMAPMSLNYKRPALIAIAEKWGLKVKPRMTITAIREMLMLHGDVIIINPESAKTTFEMSKKLGVVFDGYIVDESTRIKNHKAQITLLVHQRVRMPETRYFYLMTGEPRPQSEEDYWSQMYCVDETLLGSNFYGFRSAYFVKHKWLEFKYEFNKEYTEELSKLIAMKSYTVHKKDCLDLLEPMTIIREVELSDATRKLYKQMEALFYSQLSDQTVTASTKASSLGKMRQILSGFVIDTDKHETHRHGGKEKLNELKNSLDELGDEPVVIWITFKEEANMILEALGADKCVVANSEHDSDVALERFMSNDAQYLVAHPASLRYGVTLTGRAMTKNCTYAIYYSKDKNYENFHQSKDRIQRIGQTAQVTYIHLIAEDTIDWDIHKTIGTKQSLSEFFADLITQRSKGE